MNSNPKGGIGMLKEIKARHEYDDKYQFKAIGWVLQAHQDRAYLLGVVEESQKHIANLISIIQRYSEECPFAELYDANYFLSKLESEGRE
jgi:hypothetical protein